jgi:hypothetical protein
VCWGSVGASRGVTFSEIMRLTATFMIATLQC